MPAGAAAGCTSGLCGVAFAAAVAAAVHPLDEAAGLGGSASGPAPPGGMVAPDPRPPRVAA